MEIEINPCKEAAKQARKSLKLLMDVIKPASSAREKRLLARYGITEAQWERMYARQNGKCPICLRALLKPDNKWGRRASPVDHDHKTKRVRGITCTGCNRFKIAKNNAESAKRLLPYLDSDFDGRNI